MVSNGKFSISQNNKKLKQSCFKLARDTLLVKFGDGMVWERVEGSRTLLSGQSGKGTHVQSITPFYNFMLLNEVGGHS